MSFFFTSDSHFSVLDKDEFTRDYRPFKSLNKMNNKIIKIWNKQAKKSDIIYHLGDFISYNLRDKEYQTNFKFIKKIKADVILIMGNNEERVLRYEFKNDFETFKNYLLELGFKDVIMGGIDLDVCGQNMHLNHYPSKHKEGVINLFGHIHKSALVKRYGFNMGLDNHYLKLFSEKDVLDLIERIPFFDGDTYD